MPTATKNTKHRRAVFRISSFTRYVVSIEQFALEANNLVIGLAHRDIVHIDGIIPVTVEFYSGGEFAARVRLPSLA
ncbi:hypothetical protein [Fuerstiella marisgermanici]|nr:hypothetical protein [Fuerstiella marisgermanici]